MKENSNLRFFMDETSSPYSEDENSFVRTEDDDDFDEMIIKKYKLVTNEQETLLTR
jgi:hypothetical protein